MKRMLSEKEALIPKEAEATATATARSFPIQPLLSLNSTYMLLRDGRIPDLRRSIGWRKGRSHVSLLNVKGFLSFWGHNNQQEVEGGVKCTHQPVGRREKENGKRRVRGMFGSQSCETDWKKDQKIKLVSLLNSDSHLWTKKKGNTIFIHRAGQMRRYQGPRFSPGYVYFNTHSHTVRHKYLTLFGYSVFANRAQRHLKQNCMFADLPRWWLPALTRLPTRPQMLSAKERRGWGWEVMRLSICRHAIPFING